MPYDNPKQAAAVFLSIERKQGLQAAKAFGRKHSEDMKRAGKATYRSRRSRNA